MEPAEQPNRSRAARLWLLALLTIAVALLAPTYFALRWWLQASRSQRVTGTMASEVVAVFRADYQPQQPKAGWRYLWNANGPLGNTNHYVELQANGERYTSGDLQYPAPGPAGFLRLSSSGGHPGRGSLQNGRVGENFERAVIAAFALPRSGPVAIRDSFIHRHDGDRSGGIRLRVFVNNAEIGPNIFCDTREQVSFDRDLGELSAGDSIFVCVGADESDEHDAFGMDFAVAFQPPGQLPIQRPSPTPAVSEAPRPARVVPVAPIVADNQLIKQFDPASTNRFYPVPMEPFYQRRLDSYRPTDVWGVVPQGLVEFDGVPFRMFGKIEMTGMGAARNRDFGPPRVGEIPIRRRAARLHLIGGAGYKDPDGTPVAAVRLHYANGEQRSIFIAYGEHVRNWHVASDEKRTDVRDPRCYIVWNGTHPTTGGPLRLFKNTFDNPLPAAEIRSLEFLSLFANSFLALCAVTLEDPAPGALLTAAAAEDPDDSPYRREALLRVLEAGTGQAVSNATLALTVTEGAREYGFGRYRSDRLGQILLDYPPGRFSSVRLQCVAPGFFPVSSLQPAPDGLLSLPPELLLTRSPGAATNAPTAAPVRGAQAPAPAAGGTPAGRTAGGTPAPLGPPGPTGQR